MATSVNLGRVTGYSAYEVAVQNGYTGTEEQWLESLDGFSPVATVSRNQDDNGVTISITDASGTTTADVYDGSGGGGSTPVDPEGLWTNVLTGGGYFANAWNITREASKLRWSVISNDSPAPQMTTPVNSVISVTGVGEMPYEMSGLSTLPVSYTTYNDNTGYESFEVTLEGGWDSNVGRYIWSNTTEGISMVYFYDVDSYTVIISNSNWTNDGETYLEDWTVVYDQFETEVAEIAAGSGTTYTAGTGISISNNEISVDSTTVAMQSDLSSYATSASLATVATTGDYSDLSNTPTIPTALSDLTNDEGFITASDIPDELPTISSGDAGKVLAVNSGETGVEWTTVSAGSSVSADGSTIIDNNGVLSTAVGGGRTLAWGRTLFFEWNSTDYPSATCSQSSSNSYIKMSGASGHFLHNMDYYGGSASDVGTFTNLLNYLGIAEYIKLNWYVEATQSDDTVLTGRLKYSSRTSDTNPINILWTNVDSSDAFVGSSYLPKSQNGAPWNDAAIWLCHTVPSSDVTYKDLKVYIEPKYNYTKISADYIPVDNSSLVVDNGTIKAGLNISRVKNGVYQLKDDTNGDNTALIIGQNTYSPSNSQGTFVAGYDNSTNNGYRNAIIGQNNSISNKYDVRLLGMNLAAQASGQTILGQYNSTSTDPFVIGMGTASNNRVDAMTINSSAKTTFNGDVQFNGRILDDRGNPIGGVSFPISGETGSEADGEIDSVSIRDDGTVVCEQAMYAPDPENNDSYILEESYSAQVDGGGIGVHWEDSSNNSESVTVSSVGITIHRSSEEPDPEDSEATAQVSKSVDWTMDGIQLVDQSTGDIYTLSINNGQISLSNASL